MSLCEKMGQALSSVNRAIAVALLIASVGYGQQTMHLTLAEAEKLAIQNNPQLSGAKYTAAAAYQTPKQYQAAYAPNVFGA